MGQAHALLIRGINVGAHHRITMKGLIDVLSGCGFDSIDTYLQSGNLRVQSATPSVDAAILAEEALSAHFGKPVAVAALSWNRLCKLADCGPFAAESLEGHKRFGIFLRRPSTNGNSLIGEHGALRIIRAEPEVLLGLLREGQTHTLDLKKLVERPMGTPVTARYWNVIEDWIAKYR